MTKRILLTLMAFCMALAILPTAAFAAEAIRGTCGDNVTWTYNNGTLTISGNGAIQDYTYDSPAEYYNWRDEIATQIKKIKTVIINEGVTSIGRGVFYGCDSLTSVIIPNSVTNIGESAFRHCISLSSVIIPNSVTSIGGCAFEGCASLSSVIIPNGVISIGGGAFFNCESLTTIQVDIGNLYYASINGVLFTKDTKTLVMYPGEKQGSYTIPNSVTSIEMGAFAVCSGLTSVNIPNSVTTIGECAFYGCESLTSVTIPSGVTSIGDCAFGDSLILTDVYFSGSEAQWNKIKFGDDNFSLLNATIHYNSVAPAIPQQPARFTDVTSGQWYSEAVAWAVEQGITNGTGADTFSPNKTCTNAEIITFLYRANNSLKVSTTLPFTPKNAWATDALKWAYSKGIIGADFNEQTPCTRYTTVEYFWKAFGAPNVQAETQFNDISGYNGSPIDWAVQNGIVYGTGATTFSPDVTCNRATIVTLLQRAYGE